MLETLCWAWLYQHRLFHPLLDRAQASFGQGGTILVVVVVLSLLFFNDGWRDCLVVDGRGMLGFSVS